MDVTGEFEPTRFAAGFAGVLGLASVVLLGAGFRWAHHWGPLTDAIVLAWAVATFGALSFSIWSLRTSRAGRRLAKIGLWSTVLSLSALAVVGVAAAAGFDAAGACGGG